MSPLQVDWAWLFVGLFVLVCVVAFALFISWAFHRISDKEKQRELEEFKTTYQRKTGQNHWHGPFDIMTFDGGKSWWNVQEMNGELSPLGPADPDLLAFFTQEERLAEYERRYGPISVIDPEEDDLRFLQQLGLKITRIQPTQPEPQLANQANN